MMSAEPIVKAFFRKLFEKFSMVKRGFLRRRSIFEGIWNRRSDPSMPPVSLNFKEPKNALGKAKPFLEEIRRSGVAPVCGPSGRSRCGRPYGKVEPIRQWPCWRDFEEAGGRLSPG